MADKNEKERRKQIMHKLKQEADQDFDNSLPMSRDNFKKLFDHLEEHLNAKGCDETNNLTKTFLATSHIEKEQEILEWLASYGGYCDCEILANVEELFD